MICLNFLICRAIFKKFPAQCFEEVRQEFQSENILSMLAPLSVLNVFKSLSVVIEGDFLHNYNATKKLVF